MPLKDNWFREHSPADIISKVGVVTLAEISKWTSEELQRVGFTDDNPIIKRLYELTSAGVWVVRKAGSSNIVYPYADPTKATTTDDTAVRIGSNTLLGGVKCLSTYQDSGGALTLSFGNAAKTSIVYQISINTATLTMLPEISDLMFGYNLYAWWSAAAGANQYVNVQRYYLSQLDQNGD